MPSFRNSQPFSLTSSWPPTIQILSVGGSNSRSGNNKLSDPAVMTDPFDDLDNNPFSHFLSPITSEDDPCDAMSLSAGILPAEDAAVPSSQPSHSKSRKFRSSLSSRWARYMAKQQAERDGDEEDEEAETDPVDVESASPPRRRGHPINLHDDDNDSPPPEFAELHADPAFSSSDDDDFELDAYLDASGTPILLHSANPILHTPPPPPSPRQRSSGSSSNTALEPTRGRAQELLLLMPPSAPHHPHRPSLRRATGNVSRKSRSKGRPSVSMADGRRRHSWRAPSPELFAVPEEDVPEQPPLCASAPEAGRGMRGLGSMI